MSVPFIPHAWKNADMCHNNTLQQTALANIYIAIIITTVIIIIISATADQCSGAQYFLPCDLFSHSAFSQYEPTVPADCAIHY